MHAPCTIVIIVFVCMYHGCCKFAWEISSALPHVPLFLMQWCLLSDEFMQEFFRRFPGCSVRPSNRHALSNARVVLKVDASLLTIVNGLFKPLALCLCQGPSKFRLFDLHIMARPVCVYLVVDASLLANGLFKPLALSLCQEPSKFRLLL